MSRRYKGGVISATPPTTTGGLSGTAVGVWTLKDQAQKQGMSIWPIANNFWIGLLTDTGSGNRGYDITADSSGNVYTTGYVDVNNRDIATIKYNSLGAIQWQKSLGSTSSTYADGYGVNIDSSGNVYSCGLSNAGGISGSFITAKYDSSGAIQWQRYAYESSSFGNQAENVAIDSSGNVYVVGTTGFSLGEDDVYRLTLIKYNSSGTIQWVRRAQASSPYSTYGYGVLVDSSGNPHVCGYDQATSSFWIAKYSSSGGLQWQVRLATSGLESYDIAIDSSSNLYVCGGSGAMILVKYNLAGTLQWQRKLGVSASPVTSVCVDTSDNVYICGYSSSGLSSNYVHIAKYNSSGTIQWQRRLGNSAVTNIGNGIYAVAGAIYVTGYTNVGGSSKTLVAKLPQDGSGTGTYTVGGYSFVYEASSLTDSTSTYGVGSPSLTNETATLTNGTSTLTDATSSLTTSVTAI